MNEIDFVRRFLTMDELWDCHNDSRQTAYWTEPHYSAVKQSGPNQ